MLRSELHKCSEVKRKNRPREKAAHLIKNGLIYEPWLTGAVIQLLISSRKFVANKEVGTNTRSDSALKHFTTSQRIPNFGQAFRNRTAASGCSNSVAWPRHNAVPVCDSPELRKKFRLRRKVDVAIELQRNTCRCHFVRCYTDEIQDDSKSFDPR